ncbi:DUF3040 domain-containing protein [Amycolatopsis sp. NPDC051371]|jgi:hypothetical protein|uniref:DUF3040 domain-containing protein n=1 Tax=Amycolatopsis sp. NPDC051371 TaxID=3155800 RepID=UPI0034323470
MLPEHESRALRGIEERLRAEDPRFAAVVDRFGRVHALRWYAMLVLAEITAAVMIVTGVFSGDGWVFFWGAAGAAVLARLHVTRFRTSRRLLRPGRTGQTR